MMPPELKCEMDNEQQLKLQAFFDGELPEKEARDVAAWLAGDAEATALLAELRNTRKALAVSEPVLRVPESREFFWSKIRREIERLEPAPEPAREPAPLFKRLRRFLVSAGSVAALAAILFVAGLQYGFFGPSAGPDTEMTLAKADTFTYRDNANGTTLVWVSFPAER
jgi:anti-sigma factor RsiW